MAENTTSTAPLEDTTGAENSAPERAESTTQNQRPAGIRMAATDLLPELAEGEAPVPTQEVSNGRSYEITYIVQANVANAIEETQQGVTTLIENAGGAVDNARVSEIRRLAYPIDKKSEGVYVVLNTRFGKELTTELDRFFKLEERILRHVILRVDA